MIPKIAEFFTDQKPPTPCLVVDLDSVAQGYRRVAELLPHAVLHYAVKANPAPQILELLSELGASFDAASLTEVEACLAAGAPPSRISYGNTIKKQSDIAR
ncbi:MAG: type III PLP-dependent enzyme, partial [Alphaproteobacteria bacterium]